MKNFPLTLNSMFLGLAFSFFTGCSYDPSIGYAQPQYQAQPYQQPQPVYRSAPPVYTQAQPTQAYARPAYGDPLDLGYKKIVTTPYNKSGFRYVPMSPQQAIYHVEHGVACYYSETLETSIGEKAPPGIFTAAHKTLPLPCVVRVTNLENGRVAVVRVNDRGPFRDGRMIDVNVAAAEALGFTKKGLVNARMEVLSVGDGRLKIRR